MNRLFFVIGCFLASTGVLMGAVAAHSLEKTLPALLFHSFETAAKYQLVGATFLLVTGIANSHLHFLTGKIAGWMGLVGVILFSGSLYAYSLSEIKFLVYITPFGGILMISAWLVLGWSAIKKVNL